MAVWDGAPSPALFHNPMEYSRRPLVVSLWCSFVFDTYFEEFISSHLIPLLQH